MKMYLTGLSIQEYRQKLQEGSVESIEGLHLVKDWNGPIPRKNEILRPTEPTYEYEFYTVDMVLYDVPEGIIVIFLFNPMKEMKRNPDSGPEDAIG